MKNVIFATAAAALLATSAHANCAKSNWSVGVVAGWQGTDGKAKTAAGTKLNDTTYSSAPIALALDWNHSVANSWMYGFGIEAGYIAGNPSNNFSYLGTNYKATLKPNAFGTLNARLGWDFGNKWALYGLVSGRAMGAKAELKDLSVTPNTTISSSDTVWGIGLGAGVNVKFAERWSAGVEYRYYWDQDIDFDNNQGKVELGSNVVLAKVSYNF